MEIERKFIITALPTDLDSYDFFVDDNDEKSLITCKISMHEKKESW